MNKAKKIKSDKYMWSNRKKQFSIEILKNVQLDITNIYFTFWKHQ